MPVDIEKLKQTHAIADVLEAHGVKLRRSGRRFMGLCPFHADNRPSFVVYVDTRSAHCFGCGFTGDVLDVVRRLHGLGFLEAVAYLGELPPWERRTPPQASTPPPPKPLSLDDRLILTAACELYHAELLRTPRALAYLEKRAVPSWLIRRERLGYSDGDQLMPYLKRRRLSVRRAAEMGLFYPDRRNGGLREAMRGRIVIPDLRPGYCGWMTGRDTNDQSSLPYLDLALPKPLLGYEDIRGRRRAFVTEGPFDRLTLLSWGLPTGALLGTHPSAPVLRLLRRIPSRVLVMDGDEAGRVAASELAAELGDDTLAIDLPVKDVNQLAVQPEGRETFERLLAEAIGTEVRDATPA